MFDLIVLGGGPAGYHAAEYAARAGLGVLLIEERALGGTCLNEGCIPSKALLCSAKKYDDAKGGSRAYGVTAQHAQLDHQQVLARKSKIVNTLVKGVRATLEKAGVTVLTGRGEVQGRGENGFEIQCGTQKYEGKHLLVATGSQATIPRVEGIEDALRSGFAMTTRECFACDSLPRRLLVIGGGVVGMEMAAYFCSAGCQVTVVEMLDKVGGPIDGEAADMLRKAYEQRGITFLTGCRVLKLTEQGALCVCHGDHHTLEADKVLIAAGRRANTAGIGLETLGVTTARGAIVTDEKMCTNVPNVYAAGDVNGRSMLAHTAYREAEVAVHSILGQRDRMGYDTVPTVLYTSPEIASIGESEESAGAKGWSVKTVKLPMRYNGRYLAETEGENGFCKMVYDPARDCIVGATLVGHSASEIISAVGILVDLQVPLQRAKTMIFPHPTVSEMIKEMLFHL